MRTCTGSNVYRDSQDQCCFIYVIPLSCCLWFDCLICWWLVPHVVLLYELIKYSLFLKTDAVDKVQALKRYKFSLAFENSNEEDYVTEKFFQSLVAGMKIILLPTSLFLMLDFTSSFPSFAFLYLQNLMQVNFCNLVLVSNILVKEKKKRISITCVQVVVKCWNDW